MKLQIELSTSHIESKHSTETQFTKNNDLIVIGLGLMEICFRAFSWATISLSALHRAGVIVERKTTSQTAIIVMFVCSALPQDSLRQIVSQ